LLGRRWHRHGHHAVVSPPDLRLALKPRHRDCGRAMTLDAGGKGTVGIQFTEK